MNTSPPATFRYIAIGASDSVGVGATDPATGSWPARVAARLPSLTSHVNLGVSGSTAAQASREQLPAALALKPQLVTIWLAVNDLNLGLTAAEYAAALGSVIEPLVRGTDARIFVGTAPDLRSVPAFGDADQVDLLGRVTAYNMEIVDLAALLGARVTVVDLFTGSAELTSMITVSTDGFHPSDDGYALIADRFLSAIARAGIPLR